MWQRRYQPKRVKQWDPSFVKEHPDRTKKETEGGS